MHDFFGKILLKQNIFKDNFSKAFLDSLIVKMKEIVLGPNEIILAKGGSDQRLFFIYEG